MWLLMLFPFLLFATFALLNNDKYKKKVMQLASKLPIEHRLLIIGQGGSGKSTLAENIAEMTTNQKRTIGIHLDQLKYGPNWTKKEPNEFVQTVMKILDDHPSCNVIMEGLMFDKRYDVTRIMLEDMIDDKYFSHIMILNVPLYVRMYRILKRSFLRLIGFVSYGSGGKESIKGIKTMISSQYKNSDENDKHMMNLSMKLIDSGQYQDYIFDDVLLLVHNRRKN